MRPLTTRVLICTGFQVKKVFLRIFSASALCLVQSSTHSAEGVVAWAKAPSKASLGVEGVGWVLNSISGASIVTVASDG